jgi:hypothetical protein
MALSPAAEDALAWAMQAADAIEEAGKNFGPLSEESRLAKAAYEHLLEDYHSMLDDGQDGSFWKKRCEECPGCPGCKDYDV